MKNHKLIRTCFLLFGLLSGIFLTAQQQITGSITDTDGSPLIGASILVKGTSTGTITDIEGNYSFTVSDGSVVLVYSYTGYEAQEIVVGSQTVINVVLQEGALLDEVVVVGYSTQKKANLTGAVTSVSADEIDARPLTSAATALQGSAPGVFINQNSGQPGRDGVLIRIRGVGTLNNSNPLVLVDGIEAPINDINPDDIETITVLKDAASASIYGSRAANGVVLVTTKRGANQEGVTFNYNGYYGISEAIRLPKLVTDAALFAEVWNEAQTNFGGDPKFSAAEIADFRANGPNSDPLNELFSTAPITQHNFSASGSSGKTNFRFSAGYLNQDGVVPKAAFERFSTRLNLDTKVTDRFTMGANIALSRGIRDSHAENISSDGDRSIIAGITRTQPVDALKNSDGVIVRPFYGVNNAYMEIEGRDFNRKDNNLLGSAYIEFEPIDDWKIKGTAAINYQDEFDRLTNITFPTADPLTNEVSEGPAASRSASRGTYNSLNLTTWLQSSYEKTIGSSYFKVLAGFTQEKHDSEWFGGGRNTFISNNILTLNAGAPPTATNYEGATTWALQSYFGRLNYVLSDKYLFEANIRYDGSSRFLNDKWGVFPSFSGGWIISEESFFNVEAIDFLKIRASWGQLGNQNIGNFRWARTLDLSQNYVFGGSIVQGVAQTSLGNPDLRWEVTESYDIGLNVHLFNSRIQIEADYFKRTTSDILYDIPIPTISGFGSQILNSAELDNKGWELNVSYRESFGDFSFNIGGNVTHVTNSINKLNKTLGEDEIDRRISGQSILQPGSPIGAYYGYQALGIFRTQAQFDAAADHSLVNGFYGVGDIELEDLDGDGVITPDDRQVIGNPNPEWIFGLNIDLGYKGFNLTTLLQGAGGYQTYGQSHLFYPFDNLHTIDERWLDRFTPDNTDAEFPRIFLGSGPSTASTNSFFLFDRTHLRLKNVNLSYTFPNSFTNKNFFTNLRVYINAQNLLTITNFPFFDPERPGGTTRGSTGFPNIKVISAGVNFNF